MSVRNTFSVKIGKKDGSGKMINYTHYAVFPIKSANLLDERLDECYLSLRHMQRQEFKPMTPVEIIYHNQVYYSHPEGDNVIYNHDESVRYFVANDKAIESPVGSKLFNHELYLIELTKYLEMIVVDSLTFTNNLGQNYDKNEIADYQISGTGNEHMYVDANREHFKAMTIFGKPYDFVAPYDMGQLYDNNKDGLRNYTCNITYDLVVRSRGIDVLKCHIYANSLVGGQGRTQIEGSVGAYTAQTPISFTYPPEISDDVVSVWEDLKSRFIPEMGQTYEVNYNYKVEPAAGLEAENVPVVNATLNYTFSVVANQLPLKRLTCTDVINRLLDLAEPLQLGEKPRFLLNAEQARQFDEIYAPQFSMTRQTLRECLKEVGKVLHGEPRLQFNNGSYEIFYDMYGGVKRAWIGRQANIYRSCQQQIETYCSSIDSTAQNLINQTDWAGGVICEPNSTNFKSVRTETQYVRISDSNMIIATDRPIYQIQKVETMIDFSGFVRTIDITPYLVESTIYNSQLSSYKSEYPYSKAYGIYYTQGEKNIKGLNFKVDHPVDQIFRNYAIVNIIKRAAAAKGFDWTPPDFDIFDIAKPENDKFGNYPKLAFRVTYLPYFDVRIAQSKSYYKDYDKSIALIVNQSANTIESKYYGENLKGTVARLGNPEVSITYILTRWWQIPKAGWLYDDDHYISAVSVEFLPTYIKCTVGLSKDFNRLNEYIGVSSEKRQYEISERQTYDRSVLYHEYIVIGDEEKVDNSLIQYEFMEAVADTFTQSGNYKPLTTVIAWGGTYDNPINVNVNGQSTAPLTRVQLPVVSTAFGNSMSFMWNYQDNYSAGSISQYEENGKVSGYWQNDYQYTDFYGRMYYYNFDINTTGVIGGTVPGFPHQESYDGELKYAMQFPAATFQGRGNYLSTKQSPYLLRKDSREIPQINVQVEFVTNRKGLIIGSALASSCGLIRGSDPALKAQLYVLDTPINKFTTVLSAIPEMKLKDLPTPVEITITKKDNNKYCLTSSNFAVDNLSAHKILPEGYLGPVTQYVGASWVIITNPTSETQTVEDEQGNIKEQTIFKGGEVLLARNGTFNVGDNIGEIWFTPKHKIFGDALPIYGEIFKATADNLIADPNNTIKQVDDVIQVSGTGDKDIWGFTTSILRFMVDSEYEWKFEGLRPLTEIGFEKMFEVTIGVNGTATREEYKEFWEDTPSTLSSIFAVGTDTENTILISSDIPFEFKSFTISRKK